MTRGIYKITNKINGHCYIGQSKYIEQRWDEHKWVSQNIKHKEYEYPLYRAFRKYEISNFDFSILEECKVEELNKKEKYWIQHYNSFFNGYNQTFGGDSSGFHIQKEQLLGIINDLKNTSMLQKEIGLKWNVHENTVQRINTGKCCYQDNIQYPIRKEKIHINNNVKYCIDCGKEINKNAIRCKSCEYKKRILQCPISKEELKNKVRNNPFTIVSQELKVSLEVLKKWLINFNIPHLRDEINKISDDDWKKI